MPRLTPATLDALERALDYDEQGNHTLDYYDAEALIAAARLTVPEVIGDRHRDGQRWQLFFPRVYGWDVGYWQNGRWWVHEHPSGYTPTHAKPLGPAPEGTDA